MYKKSAGKGARHAWTSKSTSIGALSYIAVQCYEHIQSRQSYRFRPMECVATRTQRFNLLPSLAFLCLIPQTSIKRAPSSDVIKIRPGPFSDIFCALLSEQANVLASARALLVPPRTRQLASDAIIEEDK